MEDKTAVFVLLSFLSLTFLTSQISAKKQSDVLFHTYKFGKLKNKMDRSHFNASNHFEEAQVYSQEGLKEKDLIERLPGQPHEVKFKQYGGYVTVNQTSGRAFYYYFVEAPHSHNSLPLLLWLNGGPGCSSFGFGAMIELGPFHIYSDGKTLYQNIFSWNKAANVLFLESPAGVGFSYTNSTSDSGNGDRGTAIDNYVFLVNWLERFPEYKSRDLYITGESYAGHYVPQLGQTILYHNRSPNTTFINLKGILIGNGWINEETDYRGIIEYSRSHALLSDEITDRVLNYCNFYHNDTTHSDQCAQAWEEAFHNINAVYNYNIYAPFCSNRSLTPEPNKTSVLNVECSEYYVTAYLNRAEVQRALHANLTNIPYPWQICSDDIRKKWQHAPPTTLPLLKELMENRLRVWIYSGDLDGNTPFTSTKNSIKELRLVIKDAWRAWYQDEEVGGYTQVYEGDLTFATVRGAGHEVPSYQPARALTLLHQFLAGKPLPF